MAISLYCAKEAACLAPDDVPVSAPRLTSVNPCFRTKDTFIKLIDGTKQSALELVCGGIVTWDIPQGVSSFHVTLWRAETANAISNSQPLPNENDSLRVLISLDGMPAADTVLHDSTPAETWAIPTGHARTISIQMEEEYGAFGVYLGDPGFSSQPVQAPTVRHVLNPGEVYVNLGSGPRQAAYFDFHPGERVPIQAEYAGKTPFADVQVRVSLVQGRGAHTIPVRIPLHPEGAYSVGASEWQVPLMYGPADLQLLASLNGQQVYSSSAQIALAKAPDSATVSDTSIFGVHESTNGSPFLDDDEIALWGVKWARFFLDWGVIESTPGQYDWRYMDALVQSYSAQHLELTGVLGELPPKWLVDPETQMTPAFSRFVSAALEHFKGKIKVWGLYNEIDSKFYSENKGFNQEAQPNGDILLLRQEQNQIERFDPSLTQVCCAAGRSDYLPYEKRLFDAGLIRLTDKAELHHYQAGPPEESDLGMNFVEMVQRLKQLTGLYGPPKQVWVTESNWLIGPPGMRGVFAPQVTEHEQSQYLVRAGLLSLGMHTPYFIHHPFFFSTHRAILVDSLASYSELTSLLANGRGAQVLSLPPHVYGVTASTAAGTVVALWTDSQKSVTVRVSGLSGLTIEDMYGNPVSASDELQLTGSPMYLIGQGSPVVTAEAIPTPAQRMLPAIASWKVSPDARVRFEGNGEVYITSAPSKYARQLTSPVINVVPDHCYLLSVPLVLHQNGLNVGVIDTEGNKAIRNQYAFAYSGNDKYYAKFRVKSAGTSHLQVAVTNANEPPGVSEFEVGNMTISDCP
jgi:hypothetical protein